MKEYINLITGTIIKGTFKESVKAHKEAGWDWSFVLEDGKRILFTSIYEFLDRYREIENPLISEIKSKLKNLKINK